MDRRTAPLQSNDTHSSEALYGTSYARFRHHSNQSLHQTSMSAIFQLKKFLRKIRVQCTDNRRGMLLTSRRRRSTFLSSAIRLRTSQHLRAHEIAHFRKEVQLLWLDDNMSDGSRRTTILRPQNIFLFGVAPARDYKRCADFEFFYYQSDLFLVTRFTAWSLNIRPKGG